MTALMPLVLLVGHGMQAETPDDFRSRVRQMLAGLEQTDRRLGDYGFVRAVERKEFSSNGALRSQHSWLFHRELRDGFLVSHLIERDGKGIPEEERRANDQIIAKRLAELKAMTPEQRRKEEEENRKRAAENNAWLNELPDALDYKLAGEEMVNSRPAWVLSCEPNKGYRAKTLRARVFEKMRGRVWIDKQEPELARADVEMFDTVSIGWGMLGRIEKGTRFFIQRTRVAKDQWLPEAQTLRFSARMLLFKSQHSEVTTRFSNFRHRSELEGVASGK